MGRRDHRWLDLAFSLISPCRSALAPSLHAACKKTHINCTCLCLKAVWGPSAVSPSFPPGSFMSHSKQLIKDFFSVLSQRKVWHTASSSFWLIAGDD